MGEEQTMQKMKNIEYDRQLYKMVEAMLSVESLNRKMRKIKGRQTDR